MKKIILSFIILFSAITLVACNGNKEEIEDPGFKIEGIGYYKDSDEYKNSDDYKDKNKNLENNTASFTNENEENATEANGGPGWSISKGKEIGDGWLVFEVQIDNPIGYHITSYEVEMLNAGGVLYTNSQVEIINNPFAPVLTNFESDLSNGLYSNTTAKIYNNELERIKEGKPMYFCVFPFNFTKTDNEIKFDKTVAKSINLKIKSINYVLATPEEYYNLENTSHLREIKYEFKGENSGEFALFNELPPQFNSSETGFSYDLLTHDDSVETFLVTIDGFELPIEFKFILPSSSFTYRELFSEAEDVDKNHEEKETFDKLHDLLSRHSGVVNVTVTFIYKSGDFGTRIEHVVKAVPVSNIINITE